MYAVILAGGGGTRLWPLSRPERPKPFLPLLGDETLLQRTAARISVLVGWEGLHVVAEEALLPLVRQQLPDVPPANLVGEPVGRNTAAAVARAATAIERPDEDVMLILPADHHIAKEGVFHSVIASALHIAEGAESTWRAPLVTLGIQTAGPETGYGYIVPDLASKRGAGLGVSAYLVDAFIEKPGKTLAETLARQEGVVWNSGIFIGQRGTFLRLLETYASDLLGPIRAAAGDPVRLRAIYPTLRQTSFDYAVAEPASREGALVMIGMEVGWSDLGSWAALLEVLAGQDGAVVQRGRAEDLDSRDVLVESAGHRLVVTIGLRDTIVVDTPDVVLVCARNRAQDVKTMLGRLAASDADARPTE